MYTFREDKRGPNKPTQVIIDPRAGLLL